MRNVSPKGYSQLNQIPAVAGVYTAWLDGETLLYVGKAGGGKKSDLRTRISNHFSADRCNQFCLYVYDAYIHEKRCHLDKTFAGLELSELTKKVDWLTADWIRKRVKFQYVEMDKGEINSAERELLNKWKPALNSKRSRKEVDR